MEVVVGRLLCLPLVAVSIGSRRLLVVISLFFRCFLAVFSLFSRCFLAVFSFVIRYVLDRLTNNERKHNERRTRDEREVIEKRTKNGWVLDEICGQMYVYLTLYTVCGVEIYECRDFYVAHEIFLSTEL